MDLTIIERCWKRNRKGMLPIPNTFLEEMLPKAIRDAPRDHLVIGQQFDLEPGSRGIGTVKPAAGMMIDDAIEVAVKLWSWSGHGASRHLVFTSVLGCSGWVDTDQSLNRIPAFDGRQRKATRRDKGMRIEDLVSMRVIACLDGLSERETVGYRSRLVNAGQTKVNADLR